MRQASTWSLLVVFGGLPILAIGINQAANDTLPSTTAATSLATRLFNSFNGFMGSILLLVAVAIIASWAYSTTSSGGGF